MERQYRVLIVDDNNDIRTTYQDYFTEQGFIVDVAPNGLEGLEKLREIEFDVALVDLEMPLMKGLEMLKIAREEGRDTETVILSEHGNKDDAIAAIKMGVRDWFEKSSLEMSKLLDKVKELAEGVPLDEIRRILSVIPD